MKFYNELRYDCYMCHGKLTPQLSEIVKGKFGNIEYVLKNVPKLECKKCGFYYSAEPFHEQKTEIFQELLRSLPFLSITIEYKSMIDYVDRELLDQSND